MKKFWKWMVKNNYCDKDDASKNVYWACTHEACLLNMNERKQMLRGYKIEYLFEMNIDFVIINSNVSVSKNIDSYLDKKIEEGK